METQKDKGVFADRVGLAWGILLIVFGVVALVGMYMAIPALWWVIALTAAGLAIVTIYLTDRSKWGLLFPACGLLAGAGGLAMGEWAPALHDDFIVAYVLTMVAIPFLVGFLRNRSLWGLLIPVGVLLAIAFGLAVIGPLTGSGILADEFIVTYIMAVIALPFLLVFIRDRSQWWALIPAYVLLSIGMAFLLLSGGVQVAIYTLTAIALPFVLVFVLNTERWWALVPAYVLFAISVMIWLDDRQILRDFAFLAYILFTIAIPFFVVFVRNPKEQWPLIPASILAVMGLMFVTTLSALRYIAPALLIIAGGGLLIAQFIRRRPSSEHDAPAESASKTTPPPAV